MKHTIQGCSEGYIAYTTGDLITQNRDDTIGWANVGYWLKSAASGTNFGLIFEHLPLRLWLWFCFVSAMAGNVSNQDPLTGMYVAATTVSV